MPVPPRDLSFVTPCQCAEYTPACTRAGVAGMTAAQHARCRDTGRAGCLLRWLWDGMPAPPRRGDPPVRLPAAGTVRVREARRMAVAVCRHLGAALDDGQPCGGCQGNVRLAKRYGCNHPAHGETTLAACQDCKDREVREDG